MPKESNSILSKNQSRRSFLSKLSFGILAVTGLALLSRSVLGSGTAKNIHGPDEFPGTDSIYHPRINPRVAAEETKQSTT